MTIERPMFPPTRRAFVGAIATLPLAVAAAAPAAATAEPDPIFAAIDLHLQARKDHHDAIDIETALEIERWKEKIVKTDDDPREIAAERAVAAASDAMDEAAVGLLNVQPTTIAGLMALLDYFSETEEELFPSGIIDDEGEMSFVHAFVAHASQSLADIAQTLAQATV